MRDIDDFLSKAVIELQSPLKGKGGGELQAEKPSGFLFEDGQPVQIQAEWTFKTPRMARQPVTIDLLRLLKYYDLSSLEHGGSRAKELLSSFTNDLTLYRKKCQVDQVEENDLVFYLNFLDILSQNFENNSTPFLYEGYPGSSDKFQFELLNVLLMLLACYSGQATRLNVANETNPAKHKELSRSRARLFLLCTEVLKELHTKATQGREQGDSGSRICYQHAPRSLSMDPVKGIIIANMDGSAREEDLPQSLTLDSFIQTNLGGERSILARYHLCMAKKHESLFAVTFGSDCGQALNTDVDGKLRANLIGRISLIEKAYLETVKYAKDATENESLAQHARFMAHYWLCHAHYILAKHDSAGLLDLLGNNEETHAEIELAQEVLARVMFITRRAIEMEKDSLLMSKLSMSLGASYNTMIEDVQRLTMRFDKEIYDRRGLHEKQMDFQLQAIPERPNNQNLFVEARKTLFTPYYIENPTFKDCRLLLRALGERLKQPTHGKELLISASRKVSTPNRLENASALEPIEKKAKLLLLGERQGWLTLFLESYNPVDGEFVFSKDLYEKIKHEMSVTQWAIQEVTNQ